MTLFLYDIELSIYYSKLIEKYKAMQKICDIMK